MKLFKIIFIIVVLAGITGAGFYLRILNPDGYKGKVNAVYAYYFSKAKHLNDFGRLPEEDIWSFAPEARSENVPPLLAYGTVGAFKLAKLFKPGIDFYDFAMFFPPIVFVFWAVSGFWLAGRLFKNHFIGFLFAGFLAVTPLSFGLTLYGSYFEEGLGVFLFFLSLIFLIEFMEAGKSLFFWLTISSLTAFYLTWQQFPVFIAGLFILGLVGIIRADKNRLRIVVRYSLLIVLPVISGHLISRYLMRVDYSPALMLYETFLGVKNVGQEFIRVAMLRPDWKAPGAGDFLDYFGLLFLVLAGIGFVRYFSGWKQSKSLMLLVFSFLTLAVAINFYKSRYLALAPLLLVSCFGGEFFLLKNKDGWRRAAKFFSGKKIKFFGVGALLVATFMVFYLFFPVGLSRPRPVPEIVFSPLPENLESGGEYQIGMKLENRGGESLWDAGSFGGFHVEVENAEVKDIVAWSDAAPSQIVIKPDAQREDVYWFEVKYNGSFKTGESGHLWFKIIPKDAPVNVYWRAWLPGEVTFWQRLKTWLILMPPYRTWQNSWRSEEAIQRLPSNDDASGEFCLVKVYAAHKTFQDFRCSKQVLE